MEQEKSNMALLKLGAGAAFACLGLMVLPAASQARQLGTVDWMPFFGLPYPNGYVYHPPRMECYELQPVDTPNGPRIAVVWTCGAPVRARF
jgi:hypothetical protein